MVGVRQVGDWPKMRELMPRLRPRFERAVKVAMLREAHFLRGKMIQGITSGAPGGQKFAPLAPLTLALRKLRGFGGTKILIVSGTLRGAILVTELASGGVFIGVHRSARGGKGGKTLYNLARLHEEGGDWSYMMTPKQRRFLFASLARARAKFAGRDASGKFLKKGAANPFDRRPGASSGGARVTVHLPARPFIRPTLEMYGRPDAVKRRLVESILKTMDGTLKPKGG